MPSLWRERVSLYQDSILNWIWGDHRSYWGRSPRRLLNSWSQAKGPQIWWALHHLLNMKFTYRKMSLNTFAFSFNLRTFKQNLRLSKQLRDYWNQTLSFNWGNEFLIVLHFRQLVLFSLTVSRSTDVKFLVDFQGGSSSFFDNITGTLTL